MPQESNDTYSHIHHDTITGRGASKKGREETVAEDMEMGEYSILSYGDKPGAYSGPAICEKQGKKRKKESKKMNADATVDQLYAQVDKKKKDGDTTHPHPPEADTSVDQLYAQVDKKKKKDGDTPHPHPPEADTSVDQLYAQVDKKKKDGDTTQPTHLRLTHQWTNCTLKWTRRRRVRGRRFVSILLRSQGQCTLWLTNHALPRCQQSQIY